MNNGIKHDKGKLRYELVKPIMLEQLAKALHGGAEKYGDENYKLVDNERYIGALFRHLQAHRMGEIEDKDSGLHPMAHVMACAAIILQKDLEAREHVLQSIKDFQIPVYSDEDLDIMEAEHRLREMSNERQLEELAGIQNLMDQYSGKNELEEFVDKYPEWLKAGNKPYPPEVPPEVIRGLEDCAAGRLKKIKFKVDKKKKKR